MSEIIDLLKKYTDGKQDTETVEINVSQLNQVIEALEKEPKIGYCRDCQEWKDSDGSYRRGIGAESRCPMNRVEVYEGTGYCYMFK